jgi:hypothetical protein
MRHERCTGREKGIEQDLARFWFDDLQDYLTHVEAWDNKRASVKNPPTIAWDKGIGYDKALEYAKYGWSEGAEEANKQVDKMTAYGEFTKSLFYFSDEAGQYELADTERALSGDMEYWFTERHEKGLGEPKFVKLVTNLSASASIVAETLYNRALALACLVALFERAEVHTEIWIVLATKDNTHRNKGFEALVKIKSYYEPLDVERIAFCIGHPAFFRRMGFVAYEMLQQPAYQDIWDLIELGYGWPKGLSEEALAILQPDLSFGEMRREDGTIDWNNQQAVRTWLKETLNAHGVEITFGEALPEQKERSYIPRPPNLVPKRAYRRRRKF